MTVRKSRLGQQPEAASLGPHATYDRGVPLSLAQSLVLDELARAGQFRLVTELADRLGQHPNTVREHLDALVGAGLVDRRGGHALGRGRPPNEYRARPLEQSQPSVREYAGLAGALAAQIAATSARPESDALDAGVRWGAQLAAATLARDQTAGPESAPSAAAARRQVVDIMAELGFAPDADRRMAMVRLRGCPLLEAARQHTAVVCGVHLGLVRGALMTLGADPERATLIPFAEVGACRLNLFTASQTGRRGRQAAQPVSTV